MRGHAPKCDCYRCFDERLQRYVRWSRRAETVCWAIITALVIWLAMVIDSLPPVQLQQSAPVDTPE